MRESTCTYRLKVYIRHADYLGGIVGCSAHVHFKTHFQMSIESIPAAVLGLQGALNVAAGFFGTVRPSDFFVTKMAEQLGGTMPRPAAYASRYKRDFVCRSAA